MSKVEKIKRSIRLLLKNLPDCSSLEKAQAVETLLRNLKKKKTIHSYHTISLHNPKDESPVFYYVYINKGDDMQLVDEIDFRKTQKTQPKELTEDHQDVIDLLEQLEEMHQARRKTKWASIEQ